MYDVMIIGAGVTGSAIARELMRKKRNIAVLERCSDICEGTSKANSGIVHAGFDATPGTLKAKMNVQGSRMMEALSKELDFSYKRNGSLVLCFNEADRPKLELLLEKAEKNGVEGCEIISGDEVRQMEPQVSEQVVAVCTGRRHCMSVWIDNRTGRKCMYQRRRVFVKSGSTENCEKGRIL